MRKFPATDYYINRVFSVNLAGIGPASADLGNKILNQSAGYKIQK